MTTPIVVRTFKNTAQSIDSDRELLFYFFPSELTSAMTQSIVSAFGHTIDQHTDLVLLTVPQMQYMFVTTQNAAPFTKAVVKDRLLGINYGIPKMHTTECSICTRGGNVALNLYTAKTVINYVANVNEGYRGTMGGDYMYLHFKRLARSNYPVTFTTPGSTVTASYVQEGVYYPYVLLSSVPPRVRFNKNRNAGAKTGNIAEITVKEFADYDLTVTFRNVKETTIRPYLLLGRIGTLQTLCRHPVPMSDPRYEIASSEQTRYTYVVFFDRGNSRTGTSANDKLRINAAMPIGEPMDVNMSKENVVNAPLPIGHKRPSSEKEMTDDDKKKKHKVVSAS